MKIASPRPARRARVEIIPLIDVLFFLLATFLMMSLSMIKNTGLPVRLPSARGASVQREAPALTLTIDRTGSIFWDRTPVALSALDGKLAMVLASNPDPRVLIHGDKQAPFGTVVTVLGAVRAAGVRQTALRTLGPSDGRL